MGAGHQAGQVLRRENDGGGGGRARAFLGLIEGGEQVARARMELAGRARHIWVVRDPGKLRAWTAG